MPPTPRSFSGARNCGQAGRQAGTRGLRKEGPGWVAFTPAGDRCTSEAARLAAGQWQLTGAAATEALAGRDGGSCRQAGQAACLGAAGGVGGVDKPGGVHLHLLQLHQRGAGTRRQLQPLPLQEPGAAVCSVGGGLVCW